MGDLPNEIVVMLLKELHLVDLIASRLVSKRFRSLIDSHFKFRELVAFDNESYDDLSHFNSTIEPFNCRHLFQPFRSNFLESFSFQLLFSDLRYLAVDCELANLESLNKFENLQRLELHRPAVVGQQRLSLKNLRNLTILHLVRSSPQAQLLVDSESLEKLYCDNLRESVRFARPETLRHLLIEEYSVELRQFRNLCTLKINGTYSLTEIKPDILDTLTSLTEIHLKCDGLLLDPDPLQLFVDQTVQRAARGGRLKVFVFGIEIVRSFSEYRFGEVLNTFGILQSQFDNYEALGDRLDYYTKMDYGDLLECCPDHRIPPDLTGKFSNIRIISAGLIFDADQFLSFISSCRNVIDLELNVTGLEQSFFERLTLNAFTLNYLILKGENDLNYEFCGRLFYLWKAEIYQNLEFELVFRLMKRLRYLRHFSFQQNGEQLITGRTGRSLYYLERFLASSMLERNNLSFDELVELCNSIENENKVTM